MLASPVPWVQITVLTLRRRLIRAFGINEVSLPRREITSILVVPSQFSPCRRLFVPHPLQVAFLPDCPQTCTVPRIPLGPVQTERFETKNKT